MEINDLEKMFTYQQPTEKAKVAHGKIDSETQSLARTILETVPASAEQTLAVRHLQMARMWANAGIALNHDKL